MTNPLHSTAMTHAVAGKQVRNSDASWGKFNSAAYWGHNYRSLHESDALIVRAVGEFFGKTFGGVQLPAVQNAIDVGSGSNLYPALTALPWSAHLTLTDYSDTNVEWLRTNARDESQRWSWAPFWEQLADLPGYDTIQSPSATLASRHEVQKISVFDLPAAQWGLGTMFFVAESITQIKTEFEAAVHSFLAALQPGAPFAAAFMSGSQGYRVDGMDFPAVNIGAADVREILTADTRDLDVQFFQAPPEPLRQGYDGMILALGHVGLE